MSANDNFCKQDAKKIKRRKFVTQPPLCHSEAAVRVEAEEKKKAVQIKPPIKLDIHESEEMEELLVPCSFGHDLKRGDR